MKILIAGSINEYSCYEEEGIVRVLEEELRRKGHITDSFLLPFKPDPILLLDQILAYNLLDVSNAELLITVGYPACTINHPNKIVYLLETAPMLHEHWNMAYGVLENRQYSDILISLNNIEKRCFNEARRVFCNSRVLQNDLYNRYNVTTSLLPFPVLSPKKTIENIDFKDKYYITETCLLQNSRFLEFLELFKEYSDYKICFFTPNADEVYFESFKRYVRDFNLINNVHIYEGEPSDNIIKNAEAYLHFLFQSRRADNILKRCVSMGVPVVAAKDSGYGADLADEYRCINIVNFDDLLVSLSKINRGRTTPVNLISAENFTESVIKI